MFYFYSFFDDMWFLHFPKTGNSNNINISHIFSFACVHPQRISWRIQIFYSFWLYLKLSYYHLWFFLFSEHKNNFRYIRQKKNQTEAVAVVCVLVPLKVVKSFPAAQHKKILLTRAHILTIRWYQVISHVYIYVHVSGTWILYCCMCSWLFRYDLIHFFQNYYFYLALSDFMTDLTLKALLLSQSPSSLQPPHNIILKAVTIKRAHNYK